MRLRSDSPLVRLYRRAYVEDRGWLVALGLTPQVGYVPEDVHRMIVTNMADPEGREILFRAWLREENDRLNSEAAEACREQMEKGRLSLCPFFWKTQAAVLIYGMVFLPSRAVASFVDRFLFSPVVKVGEATVGWFQRVFTNRVLLALGSTLATILLLFSLSGNFWSQVGEFIGQVGDNFTRLGQDLTDEVERNQAAKVRLAEQMAKAEAEGKVRAQAEADRHELWAHAYPERAEAEALAVKEAAAQAARVQAEARAQQARREAQQDSYERQQLWQDLKSGVLLGLLCAGGMVGVILLTVFMAYLAFLLDKLTDLVLSGFVLLVFINYPKLGNGMEVVVDGSLDFLRMCWHFALAVKARACPLLQFQ